MILPYKWKMTMKNNYQNITIDFEAIAVLKAVYEQIAKIISALANRNFEQQDYQLNSFYNILTSVGNKILSKNKKFFNEHDIQPPAIPDNLIGDIKDIDILWENKIGPKMHEFLGKVERVLLEAGNPKYELMPELNDLFKKIDDTLDRIIRQDDDDFAKLATEASEKNPFLKRENKLERPKVSRMLKSGLLNLNLTTGTLQYGNNLPVEISPEKTEVKFLAILMSNQRIVEYKELGEEFMRGSSIDRATNQGMARNIQFLKRDLLSYLKENVGMPKDQVRAISKMIEAKRGKGYKLRQQ